MKSATYFDLLTYLGIESAHPGGFNLTKKALNKIKVNKGHRLLEVGCGSGKTSSYVYNQYRCNVVALEKNDNMLAKAAERFKREKVPIKLVKGDVEQLPFSPVIFDGVISESVTAFCTIEKAVNEYARVLKGNGFFLAIEMTAERELSIREQKEIENVYGIKETLTEEGWLTILSKSGFNSTQVLYHDTIASTIVKSENEVYFPPTYIPPNLLLVWDSHQELLQKYKHLLGHRVFLCRK